MKYIKILFVAWCFVSTMNHSCVGSPYRADVYSFLSDYSRALGQVKTLSYTGRQLWQKPDWDEPRTLYIKKVYYEAPNRYRAEIYCNNMDGLSAGDDDIVQCDPKDLGRAWHIEMFNDGQRAIYSYITSHGAYSLTLASDNYIEWGLDIDILSAPFQFLSNYVERSSPGQFPTTYSLAQTVDSFLDDEAKVSSLEGVFNEQFSFKSPTVALRTFTVMPDLENTFPFKVIVNRLHSSRIHTVEETGSIDLGEGLSFPYPKVISQNWYPPADDKTKIWQVIDSIEINEPIEPGVFEVSFSGCGLIDDRDTGVIIRLDSDGNIIDEKAESISGYEE